MTLIEYTEMLNTFLQENPVFSECEVIYFTDDEGNAAHSVSIIEPQVMFCENPDEYYLEVSEEVDSGVPVIVIN